MSTDDDAELDEFCRAIGLRILKTAWVYKWAGWTTPRGASHYLHGEHEVAQVVDDFIRWCVYSDLDAAERLRAVAIEHKAMSRATPEGEKFRAFLEELTGIQSD